MINTPWAHQIGGYVAMQEAYRAGKRAILCVIPTGGGKSYLFSRIANGAVSKGFRWLVFVHRDELLEQTVDGFRELGLSPGVICAGYPRTSSYLQVVSVQTALSRGVLPEADGVVFDEAHHFCGAEKWSGIPLHYKAQKALILGFTATPERSDGAALGNVFDHMIVVCQPLDLIKLGVLVHARVIHPNRLSKTLAMHPLEFHSRYGRDRRFIVFAASVKHAKALAHEFSAAGFPCACVDGAMGVQERRSAIARFRRGELQGLTNFMVLTEGFNVREVSEIITCRAFSSAGPMMQAVGRGMRSYPGKTDVIVGDLRGWCTDPDVGMPEEERHFSLDGKPIKRRPDAPAPRQCPECFLMFPAKQFEHSICPACGYVVPGKTPPAVRRQSMEENAAAESAEDRLRYLSRCVNSCLIDGHEIGRACWLYMDKYTPSKMRACAPRRAWSWPRNPSKDKSGYDAAAAMLKEIAIYNLVHRCKLRPMIGGIPGAKNKDRPWVDTRGLVDLIRQALISGHSEGDVSGRWVTVEMVDTALKETGT